MKASDWRPIKNLRDIKHGPDKAGVLLYYESGPIEFHSRIDLAVREIQMVRKYPDTNYLPTHWQPVAKPKPVREQNQIAAGWNWHPAAKPKPGKD